MKTKLLLLSASLLIVNAMSAFAADDSKPDPAQLKYGLYLQFGMPTFAKPGQKGQIPASQFAPPANLDARSWAHTAREMGMQFAVLTVKHESGFCLWDSPDYDYDVGNSPFKGDIIGDFIAACNAEGVLPGVHYSIPDAYNEGMMRYRGPVPPPYFNVIKKHITELHTKYPGIRVQIFDVSQRLSPVQWEELTNIVHRLNPACVILDWTHPPIYGTQTVNKGWMWSPNEKLNSPDFLYSVYSKRMESGASWLANVGIDPSGNIPNEYLEVLKQLKTLIERGPVPGQVNQSAPAGAPAQKPDAASRLKQVKSLYDQGLINKEEYDKKVKEIMDSL